jgi:glycosyltransferase involved in cell wall biosynthesis
MRPPASDAPPEATVAITTRNRCGELRRALRSAVAQEGAIEVLVIDDGSSDGTAEMVGEEFPEARLVRFEHSAGLIARRNDLAMLVRGRVLVSLDDDAEFTAPDVVAHALEPFAAHPRVGAVAIPYVERGRGETEVRQTAPEPGRIYATGPYIGTAHALRVEVFRALGGYRPTLVRNTEELDYWTRMLAAGYVTSPGWGPPIHHHESPRRVVGEVVYYDCRNNLLHAWRNVPMPYALGRAAKVSAYALAVVSRRTSQPAAVLRGLAAGAITAARTPTERRPVARELYLAGRAIRYAGTLPIEAVEPRLPPLP